MSWITERTSLGTSTYVLVVISPDTTQMPVVTRTSHATRPVGSAESTSSRTASEIWSAILSGWPSVTDSDVKICRIRSTCDVPPEGLFQITERSQRPQYITSRAQSMAVQAGPRTDRN